MSTPSVPELRPLPSSFAATRDGLHQLAFFVVAPRRHDHARRLGLTAVPGGFGTPPFDGPGGRERVLVRGERLVVERDEVVVADVEPATIGEACEVVDVAYRETWFDDFHDPLAPQDPSTPMALDPEAARRLADWFAFGTLALEQFAMDPAAVDATEVQLWPEHFDPAMTAGSADGDGGAGSRASFGASPGDADHDEPYLFVAPWSEPEQDDFWNDHAFRGASLAYAELLDADDPLGDAVSFLRRGMHLLGPSSGTA